MTYYHTPASIDQYVDMAAGYDGKELVHVLRQHLPRGSTVLELGMGPGKDLDLLAETYSVVGSDFSQLFLDRYRSEHPDAELLLLDAMEIKTPRRFDAIYSNKVLHHLTPSQLARSFQRQGQVLVPGGIAMHSFWYGSQTEEYEGLLFTYHTEDSLALALGENLNVVEIKRYTEMETDDSFYVLLAKRSQ